MCVEKICKYLLFLFNFCFWAAGVALLGVSIWLLVDDSLEDVVEVAGINIYTGSYVLVAAGAVMLVVGFAGCCGALKESTCLLGLYFVCLFCIFGVQIGIAIWGFIEFNSLEEAIEFGLNETAKANDGIDGTDPAFKNLQQTFSCCGTVKICEGFETKYYDGCECTADSDDCKVVPTINELGCESSNGIKVWQTPCDEAIYEFVDDNMLLVAGIALGIGLAEVLGMIIACCLCNQVKEKGQVA